MLKSFPISSTTILVEWRVPNIYDQNGILTAFTIRYSSPNTERERILPVSDNSTRFSFVLQSLEEATMYSITVAASTIKGSGPVTPIPTVSRTFNAG